MKEFNVKISLLHIFLKKMLTFFLIGITPCKVEQPLQGIELQEKEGQTD